MMVAENEKRLLDELALLPDPQERLSHLMGRAGRRPALPESDRHDGTRVAGCVSRVWLTGTLEDGVCRFRVAADSPLVLGLIALLCDVYDGVSPSEAAAQATDIMERAGLTRHLSPTRLRGLAHAHLRLRELASALVD